MGTYGFNLFCILVFTSPAILFIKNKNPRKALAEAASNFYKKKPKNIIALTGTNGKTSISNFFYQIFLQKTLYYLPFFQELLQKHLLV